MKLKYTGIPSSTALDVLVHDWHGTRSKLNPLPLSSHMLPNKIWCHYSPLLVSYIRSSSNEITLKSYQIKSWLISLEIFPMKPWVENDGTIFWLGKCWKLMGLDSGSILIHVNPIRVYRRLWIMEYVPFYLSSIGCGCVFGYENMKEDDGIRFCKLRSDIWPVIQGFFTSTSSIATRLLTEADEGAPLYQLLHTEDMKIYLKWASLQWKNKCKELLFFIIL